MSLALHHTFTDHVHKLFLCVPVNRFRYIIIFFLGVMRIITIECNIQGMILYEKKNLPYKYNLTAYS